MIWVNAKKYIFPILNSVALEKFKNMFNLVNSMNSLQLIFVCVHFDRLKAKEKHSFCINNEISSLEKKKKKKEIIASLQRDHF